MTMRMRAMKYGYETKTATCQNYNMRNGFQLHLIQEKWEMREKLHATDFEVPEEAHQETCHLQCLQSLLELGNPVQSCQKTSYA